METKPTSFRLSEKCREIIRRHAERLGVKDADVVEMWARMFDSQGMEFPAQYFTDGEQEPRGKRGRPKKSE